MIYLPCQNIEVMRFLLILICLFCAEGESIETEKTQCCIDVCDPDKEYIEKEEISIHHIVACYKQKQYKIRIRVPEKKRREREETPTYGNLSLIYNFDPPFV